MRRKRNTFRFAKFNKGGGGGYSSRPLKDRITISRAGLYILCMIVDMQQNL